MDSIEENISQKEMLEKIAELDYSQTQLRVQNAEMRHLLDVADDDMAVLRSQNTILRKQVKELEKIITEAQQVEAEPCGFLLAGDLSDKRFSEKEFQDLEKKYTTMKGENKKLTAKVKSLEEDRDEDKISLSKLRDLIQSLKNEMEEVQLALQHRDELIHQRNQQLQHLEETLMDYSNIIKDLRMTKQELSKQLEERRDETSFAILTEVMGEGVGSVGPHLSLAEEIQLVSSAEMKTSVLDSTDPTLVANEENEAEELLESPTADFNTKSGDRFSGTLRTSICGSRLVMLCIFTLLVFVVWGCFVRCWISMSTLQSRVWLMLQPYISVHYKALPPI